MKNGSFISTLFLVTFGLYSTSYAEDWKQFFANKAGYTFSFDKDSLAYPDKYRVQVWFRSVPDEAEIKVWLEWLELREVDCNRRRYKTLQGRVLYEDKPMEVLKESNWVYLEPNQLEDSFYKAVCSQRKQRNSR